LPADPRGAKRDAESAFASSSRERAIPKGGGKDGAKGKKGKAAGDPLANLKGKGNAKQLYKILRNAPHVYGIRLKTKDNQMKCHRYQARICDDKKCSYAHVCARCDGPHPATECPELGLA
jgi:hypothetical protein